MNSKKIIITALIVFLIFNTSININNYAVDFISNQKDRENGVLIGAEPYEINKDPDTTVILVHGITSSPKDFKNTANYLASKNISVKAILLPGHGTSPKDLETKIYQEWINAVKLEINNIDSKNKFLLGYSLGGAITMDIAEELDLDGIILIHAPVFLKSRYIPFIPLLKIVQKYHVSKPENIILAINDDRITYDAIPLATIIELTKLIDQLNINRIIEPTLIIQTNNDELVDPESATYIYNQISSEDKKLIWLESSTHNKPHEEEEQEIFEAISKFVKRNSK